MSSVRIVLAALLLGASLIVAHASGAAEPVRTFDSPAERDRYHSLLEDLRCLVCQNQSLESSDADLAQDLRNEVYRLVVVEDRSTEAATDFLVERYGDFVLYRPPMRPTTWLLWFGPLLMLIAGAAVAAGVIRQRRKAVAAPLSPAEHERARQLLAGTDDPREES